MKKKEEVTITFYAAECGEFHDLGEYTKCRTLEEAYKKYQKYSLSTCTPDGTTGNRTYLCTGKRGH